MRSGQNRETDDVRILLESGVHDLFWSLAEPGVDNFETGIAESACDDFGAAVVPVEAGLRDNDANLIVHQKVGSSYVP